MGYFDGLIDGSFKQDNEGNTLFYPWGYWGSGYILESESKKNELRKFLKRTIMVILIAIIVIQVLIGVWLNIVLLILYMAWHYFTMKNMLRDLPRTTEKLKFNEVCKNSAKSHNLLILILCELFFLISFITEGIEILKVSLNFSALLPLGFFGSGSIVVGYMIFTKLRK